MQDCRSSAFTTILYSFPISSAIQTSCLILLNLVALRNVRAEVSTAVTTKFTLFCDLTPYNLAECYQPFERIECLQLKEVEAARSF